MNNLNHQAMVQEAVKGKFEASDTIDAKVKPRYPQSSEREFQRVNRAYMKLFNQALKECLPEIMEAYKQERNDSRFDSSFNFTQKLRNIIQKISEKLEKATSDFDLQSQVEKLAKMGSTQATREWKRVVKKTLGINIMEDYYNGELYQDAIQKWIADNVSQITSIPKDTLDKMEQIILEGYTQGKSLRELQADIQNEYNIGKKSAEAIARDQMGTLNAQITKLQQTDAGVKKYKWSTSHDSRVRDCHKELDGQIISWDDPPEMWYDTKKGRVYTGRRCVPGQDFGCRCVAIPIFEWQTIDLPIGAESK